LIAAKIVSIAYMIFFLTTMVVINY
jgi:hypothetical protein